MKIHSDILTEKHFHAATDAAGMAGVYVSQLEVKGSRSRKRRIDLKLAGNSNRNQNHGTGNSNRNQNHGTVKAATWDEWGMFINALFEIDPNAIIGQYDGMEIFREVTDNRFDTLTAPYAHGNHKWINTGANSMACEHCDASFNWGALK